MSRQSVTGQEQQGGAECRRPRPAPSCRVHAAPGRHDRSARCGTSLLRVGIGDGFHRLLRGRSCTLHHRCGGGRDRAHETSAAVVEPGASLGSLAIARGRADGQTGRRADRRTGGPGHPPPRRRGGSRLQRLHGAPHRPHTSAAPRSPASEPCISGCASPRPASRGPGLRRTPRRRHRAHPLPTAGLDLLPGLRRAGPADTGGPVQSSTPNPPGRRSASQYGVEATMGVLPPLLQRKRSVLERISTAGARVGGSGDRHDAARGPPSHLLSQRSRRRRHRFGPAWSAAVRRRCPGGVPAM